MYNVIMTQLSFPFPGMDPFLEDVQHRRGFHNALAYEITRQLNRQIVPTYYAEVEIHTISELVIGSDRRERYPDVAVFERDPQTILPHPALATLTPVSEQRVAVENEPEKMRSIRLTMRETGELVAMIEILSYGNKVGKGLELYREKREGILLSDVHLIEIDLLRGGIRPGAELQDDPKIECEYVVLVNRIGSRRISDIWKVALNTELPTIPIPLLYPDPDAVLDLTSVVRSIYRELRYDVILNYGDPVPAPKLRPEMVQWWQEQKAKIIVVDTDE